jgi:hypothetical protein
MGKRTYRPENQHCARKALGALPPPVVPYPGVTFSQRRTRWVVELTVG